MTTAGRRSGSRIYFTALVVAQACALLRYVVLARLLGPEQLGLAVIIMLTVQFFDMITDTAGDRFLIQDRLGGQALQTVHFVSLVKGGAIALMLLLFAGPLADFAGAPQLAPALRWLAVIPLIASFAHFDFRLAQRDHDFTPEGKVVIASEIAGLVATIAAAVALRDHRAILFGLAARALTTVIASHLVARTPYGLRYSREVGKALWGFSAPLMLNGLLLFIGTQSDRIIISRLLGLEELGRYSVVLLLVLYPTSMIMRFLSAIHLPILADARERGPKLRAAAHRLASTVVLLALGIAVGFAVVAPPLVPILFGPAYANDALLVALVGLLLAFRLVDVYPTTLALALGKSRIVTLRNFVRLSGLVGAIIGLRLERSLPAAVVGLVAGEILANFAATIAVNKSLRWPLAREFSGYFMLIATGALLTARGVAAHASMANVEVLALLAALGCALMVLWYRRNTVREGIAMAKAAFGR